MAVAVRVIPCLDVDQGRVVKGINFDNLRDAGDPVELAARYDALGADELTFLDVSASKQGRSTMLEVVRRTADQVFIPLTVGGGVRSVDDVRELLRAGADKVSVNTAAIKIRNCCAKWLRFSGPNASCCPLMPAGATKSMRHPALRSPRTAVRNRPGSTPLNGHAAAKNSA